MSPAAALVLLVLAGVAVVVLGIRRERRREDPRALTEAQLIALRERYGIHDITEGDRRG